ncbi:MAG: invasion associated locus B family protein [Mesorhizobium sp.]|uniref:invasion associated locus B family protein n=2 Tax=Mesorhizobium sp. TaxID=1871066 RepID=UPI000FE6A8FD|nr:invasion associated locus B family protein [Mesorhizobium sp.]RWN02181.1 MAG: invasion associated locus B family protein [Mesorhizobium sp.]
MNSWLWGLGHSRLGVSLLGLSRSLSNVILLAAVSSVGLAGIGLSYVGSFGVSQANAAQPSGKVRTTHGAWSIICDTPAGATLEQCVMMQNVVAEDRPEMGLSVVVLRTADNKAEILRVLAPLGVLLPNGLGLNVDGKDIGRAYFVRCFQDGCYAEVILEKPLLDTLKSGTSATFIVFQTPEEGIGIPVELKGFADGFAALP